MEAIGTWFSEEFVRAFGWTLLHSIWQGALIFVVAVIIVTWMRKSRPSARYRILFALFLLLPAVFIVTFLNIYEPFGGAVTTEMAGPDAAAWMNGDSPSFAVPAESPWYSPFRDFLDQNTHWLVFSWFIGFVILLFRFTGSMIYIQRLKRTNLEDVTGPWMELMGELSDKIGVSKVVRLAESSMVKVPLTAGYLKPVILLPLGTISGVSPQMIEAILLHELAHIRRRDYLVNLIQSVIEIIFFYHPVTWWISGRIREDREHICDDLALSISNDKITYIKALTAMEEQNIKPVTLAPAMTGSRKKLLHRVTRLAYPEKIRKGFMEGMVACLMLAGIILGISANAITSTSKEIRGLYLGIQPEPDTLVAKSSSGKVTVMVYTDTIREAEQDALQDVVESIEESVIDSDGDKKIVEKKVIVLRSDEGGVVTAGTSDSVTHVIVVKDGDSLKVISNTVTVISDESGNFTWESIPPIPEMPGMPQHYEFYLDQEDFEKAAQEQEEAMREYEFQIRSMDGQNQLIERQLREGNQIIVAPGEPMPPMEWHSFEAPSAVNSTEKIIRQELREEGLISPGKSYIVEISSKAMYINGEKQLKETARKYQHLVKGLEPGILDESGTFKLLF
jgi:beta-lactamase regulating signal transducer with metallopeptidase domain